MSYYLYWVQNAHQFAFDHNFGEKVSSSDIICSLLKRTSFNITDVLLLSTLKEHLIFGKPFLIYLIKYSISFRKLLR